MLSFYRFFKGEINVFKINEVEDPSGLNFSLTFLTALILLFNDLLIDEDEHAPPTISTGFLYLFAALFLCAVVSVIYGTAGMLGTGFPSPRSAFRCSPLT